MKTSRIELLVALLGGASTSGCIVDDEPEPQELRVDYCADYVEVPLCSQGVGMCWCHECVYLSPAEGTAVQGCVDGAQVAASRPINDEDDLQIGSVILYWSPCCGAVWATTESHEGAEATAAIASFVFESADPTASLLAQPGIENVNRLGGYTRWSTAMQAATPVATACGWIEIEQEDGSVRQYGACAAGDGKYINHPPVCTEATATPGTIFQDDDEGHSRQQVIIDGVYDPDGDTITVSIPSIFQNQPTNHTGDGNTACDADGNDVDNAWVRLERAGNDDFCRRYQIEVTARDEHGATCVDNGFPAVDVTHDVSGYQAWTEGESPCEDTQFVQEYDSAGTCP